MDWPNEHYVRLYTRDTMTWIRLGWEGQCVVALLLRKLDRAGVLDIDDHSPLDVVCAVTGLPDHVVEVGLQRALDRDVFRVDGGKLVMPHYLDAQEARASDAARARRRRERSSAQRGSLSQNVTAASQNVTAASQNVTERHVDNPVCDKCDSSSQNVTAASQNVTKSNMTNSVCDKTVTQYSTVQYNATSASDSLACIDPPADGMVTLSSPDSTAGDGRTEATGQAELKLQPDEPRKRRPPVAERIFAHWQQATGHDKAKLTTERRRLIERRLKDYSEQQLCDAISGASITPHNRGENDRHQEYLSIELLLRDAEHIERYGATWTRRSARKSRDWVEQAPHIECERDERGYLFEVRRGNG